MKETLFCEIDRQIARWPCQGLPNSSDAASDDAVLSRYLADNGFSVASSSGPDLYASYGSGVGGPSLGIVMAAPAGSEGRLHQDLSPVQRSACAVGMVALARALDGKLPFSLHLYEEAAIHHAASIQNGSRPSALSDDAILFLTPGRSTYTCAGPTASRAYAATFSGKQAHAAAHPWDGRSAFDGLELAFRGVDFLRGDFADFARIQYSVTDAGGTPANVVSDLAKGRFCLSTRTAPQLDALSARLERILRGAARMTGTNVEYTVESDHPAFPRIPQLAESFYQNAEICQAGHLEYPLHADSPASLRVLSALLPCLWGQVYMAESQVSGSLPIAILAKILAGTAWDILTTPGLLQMVQNTWKKERDLSNSL